MGMIGNYYMTDEETIKKIRQGEILVEDLIYNEEDNVDEEVTLDIDKAWHAIHFTLTGEIDEGNKDNILLKVVLGGKPVNDEDVGYSPAMLITADEVKEINNEIKGISEEDFHSKFNVKDMAKNKIYTIIEDEDEDGMFEYVWGHFESLKDFYSKAAEMGKCLLFYIN